MSFSPWKGVPLKGYVPSAGIKRELSGRALPLCPTACLRPQMPRLLDGVLLLTCSWRSPERASMWQWPQLCFLGELGGRMCDDDKREELDFQNLLGTQAKIINLGLKIAGGRKITKASQGREYSLAGEAHAYDLVQTHLSITFKLFVCRNQASADRRVSCGLKDLLCAWPHDRGWGGTRRNVRHWFLDSRDCRFIWGDETYANVLPLLPFSSPSLTCPLSVPARSTPVGRNSSVAAVCPWVGHLRFLYLCFFISKVGMIIVPHSSCWFED